MQRNRQPGLLPFWIPLAFVIAGIAIYWPSFSAPFVLDDINLISNNTHIRHLWPLWQTVYTIRPLVDITLAFNYALGGYQVTGYHIFNLLVHLSASLALLGVVRRSLMIVFKNQSGESSATLIAALSAFLWMCHPLQTESVTYTIHRSESMMSLFYLLTIYGFIRGASQDDPSPWLRFSLICCAAGMATKAIMVTAPFAVLLYDRFFIAGSFPEGFKKRRKYYFYLFSSLLVLAACTSFPLIFKWYGPWLLKNAAVVHTPPLKYFIAQCAILIHYAKLCFWPYPLTMDYFWGFSGRYQSLFPCLIVLLALAGIWLAARKYPRAAFLGIMFFLILIPTSSFFPLRDLEADRRLYLPLASVMVAAVLGVYLAGLRISRFQKIRNASGFLLFAATALIFCVMTFQRNELYRSPDALWREALEVNPSNWRAINNVAKKLYQRKSYGDAMNLLKKAIAENPSCTRISSPGRHEAALSYPWPKENREDFIADTIGAESYKLMGMCYLAQGESDKAVRCFVYAVKLEPWQPENFVNLGSAMANQGNLKDAETYYKIALEIDPDAASAASNLAGIKKQGPAAKK